MTIEVLCLVFSCSVILDTAATLDWVNFHNGREANPFWARILDKPALVITLDFSIMAGVSFGVTEVAKHDKPLAIGIAIAACLVQGFWLYRHYAVRHGR